MSSSIPGSSARWERSRALALCRWRRNGGCPRSFSPACGPFISLSFLRSYFWPPRATWAPSFQIRQWPKIVQFLLNGTVFLFSAAEFLVLVFVVGLLSIRENTPRPVVEYLIKDNNEKIGNVTQQGDVVRRADMMDAAAIETAQPWALCGLFPRLRGIGKRIRVELHPRLFGAGQKSRYFHRGFRHQHGRQL